MERRTHGHPAKFGDGTWKTDERPVDPVLFENAVARFVAVFVIKTKQERMRMLLSHDDRQQRVEGIQTLYKWLRPESTSELGGNAGFPARLKERVGEVPGILIRESGVLGVSGPHASFLAAGGSGALFLADGAPLALLFPEVGPPTLVLKA